MSLGPEKEAVAEYIGELSNPELAAYLSANQKLCTQINKFFKSKLDISALINALHVDNEEARDCFDNFLEMQARNIKFHSGKIPLKLRLAISKKELLHNAKKTGTSLAALSQQLIEFKWLRASITAVKLLSEGVATVLSMLPITVRERQLATAVLAVGATPAFFLATGVNTATANIPSHTDVSENLRNTASTTLLIESAHTFTEPKQHYQTSIGTILKREFGNLLQQDREPQSDFLLSPYLVKKLQTDANARQYVAWIKEAAAENGIDWVLHANQLFRESYHFKKEYVLGPKKSSAQAMGIAQFQEATGEKYGLKTTEDFFNPRKAIFASAHHMKDLMQDYNDDHILALIAYNGGKGAVHYIRSQIGDNATGEQALAFLKEKYDAAIKRVQAKHGVETEEEAFKHFSAKQKSAYYTESRIYADDITGIGWDRKYRSWAQKMNRQYEQRNLLATAIIPAQPVIN